MNNTKTIVILIVTTILFFISGNDIITAQRLKPGPQDLSFFSKVDETDQPYAIYVPQNFDELKKYPLVVFLHGAWSNHRLGLHRAFGQGGMAFMGSKIEMLKNYKDFILFKDTPDNIISEGYFDNNWKLPAEAVSVMKTSGATGSFTQRIHKGIQ